MRTIIAGGRDYAPTPRDWEWLDSLRDDLPITEVVCGMARGADTFGRQWAVDSGLPIKEFPADWKAHGRSAGPRRNVKMAEYADALVAFPGGRGTQHMIHEAEARGLRVLQPYEEARRSTPR